MAIKMLVVLALVLGGALGAPIMRRQATHIELNAKGALAEVEGENVNAATEGDSSQSISGERDVAEVGGGKAVANGRRGDKGQVKNTDPPTASSDDVTVDELTEEKRDEEEKAKAAIAGEDEDTDADLDQDDGEVTAEEEGDAEEDAEEENKDLTDDADMAKEMKEAEEQDAP